MFRVKDPIHKIIEFNEFEKRIIDSISFQRLRMIKQLAEANLVYMGATHTRFEHSIGSMHISSKMAEKMGLNKEIARISSLIHDIGHVAFSHTGEQIIKKYENKNHEELGVEIVEKELPFVLENYSKKELYHSYEHKLCSFSVGSDRIDYIKRDAYYTGVAYGLLEDDILIARFLMKDRKFVINYSAIEAVESFFISRFMMYFAVYLHKTVRIVNSMLKEALMKAYENGEISLKDMIWKGDDYIMQILLETSQKEMAKRIMSRNLYKKVILLDINKENIEIAKEMKKYGALYSLPREIKESYDIYIEKDEGLVELEKASPLIKSIKESEKKKRKILICAENKKVKDIRENINKLIRK